MDINSNNKCRLLLRFGAHSAGEIPVTIPNTAVKPSRADYTALRETRKVPNCEKATLAGGFLLRQFVAAAAAPDTGVFTTGVSVAAGVVMLPVLVAGIVGAVKMYGRRKTIKFN